MSFVARLNHPAQQTLEHWASTSEQENLSMTPSGQRLWLN